MELMPPKEVRALGQAFSNKPNCPLAMLYQGYRTDPTLVTPVLASHQSAQRSLPAIIHTLPHALTHISASQNKTSSVPFWHHFHSGVDTQQKTPN